MTVEVDVMVDIIVIFMLILGAFICYMVSKGRKIEPKMNLRNSYVQATIAFTKLFSQPGFRKRKKKWTKPDIIKLNGNKLRNQRQLGDASLGMDLTSESNYFYSGKLFTEPVVARGNHLEYCFDSIDAMSLAMEHTQEVNMNLRYLPTIRESKSSSSMASYYSTSTRPTPLTTSRFRPRAKREIILFSTPDDRNQWLGDDIDNDLPLTTTTNNNNNSHRHHPLPTNTNNTNHHHITHRVDNTIVAPEDLEPHDSVEEYLWGFEELSDEDDEDAEIDLRKISTVRGPAKLF
jgi:hypothetical protein